MRARDKDDFPQAHVDGIFGCAKCGSYHRMKRGQRIACAFCRTARPLVYIDPPAPRSVPAATAAGIAPAVPRVDQGDHDNA